MLEGRPQELAELRPLRLAEREDIESIAALANGAIEEGRSTFSPGAWSLDETERRLFESPSSYESFVQEDAQGAVIAFAGLLQHTTRPIYVETAELEVYVDREARRQGIGARIAEHGIRRASALGFHSLLALTRTDNPAAGPLLRRAGFGPVGALKAVYTATEGTADLLVHWRRLRR